MSTTHAIQLGKQFQKRLQLITHMYTHASKRFHTLLSNKDAVYASDAKHYDETVCVCDVCVCVCVLCVCVCV